MREICMICGRDEESRYVAELAAQGDEQAKQVGETLKKLQDEIGDCTTGWCWPRGACALGDQAVELIGLVEGERRAFCGGDEDGGEAARAAEGSGWQRNQHCSAISDQKKSGGRRSTETQAFRV